MRVELITREFPPEVYGGAGVHVEYLARHLRELVDLRVHCFGAPRAEPWAVAHGVPANLAGANPALQTLGVDAEIADACAEADVVHSHTWYANLAGHLAKLLYGAGHVVTAHSLEPLRPWKAEQLGGGYALSSFAERVALESADRVIAVSAAMRDDLTACYPALDPARIEVVHNGIDTELFAPDPETDCLESLGIGLDKPLVVCVGRLTRQKGLAHLLRAAGHLEPGSRVVVCAASPDTVEVEREFAALLAAAESAGRDVLWIREPLSRRALLQLFTHAAVAVCPSVYEPMGIVNLEAMACGAPVVATRTGGIPEVVLHGETGLLVPFAPAAEGGPADPGAFAADLAAAIDSVLGDPGLAARFGAAGRRRARESFSWARIAERTRDVYAAVLAEAGRSPQPQPVEALR